MAPDVPSQTQRDLAWALLITIAVFLFQVFGAQVSNSLALLGDAFHVLSDGIGLSAAWIALWLSQRAAHGRRTFGYHRAETLAAAFNGVLLVILALGLALRGYERMLTPAPIDAPAVILIGVIGLGANLYVASLLRRNENLNIQAAFLHVVGDALTSVAVILGAVLVLVTGNYMFDGAVSLLIAVAILLSASYLLRNALSILLESAPRSAHPEKIVPVLQQIKEIREIHDVHVWSVCSDIVHFTAHIVMKDTQLSQTRKLEEKIEYALKKFGITHSTLQFESIACSCAEEGRCEIYR